MTGMPSFSVPYTQSANRVRGPVSRLLQAPTPDHVNAAGNPRVLLGAPILEAALAEAAPHIHALVVLKTPRRNGGPALGREATFGDRGERESRKQSGLDGDHSNDAYA